MDIGKESARNRLADQPEIVKWIQISNNFNKIETLNYFPTAFAKKLIQPAR